jgi:uncharacterized phiE125 gp8 family phage protein
MRYTKRVSAPSFPAVSSSQLREWLRLDSDIDQSTLDLLLSSAVDHIQSITGQNVVSADYQTTFPATIRCDTINATNITAIVVTDVDDQVIDPADYALDGQRLLITGDDLGPLTVTITAGWTDEDSVPESLRHAIAVLVGAGYDSRNEISDATFRTVERLCRPYWKPVL